MALLRKHAIMNSVAGGNDVSMVDEVSFMSDDAEDSMMDTSCCSQLANASMITDKTDFSMFDEDISFMEDEADVSIGDSNYSMHSSCSYMDVDSSSN